MTPFRELSPREIRVLVARYRLLLQQLDSKAAPKVEINGHRLAEAIVEEIRKGRLMGPRDRAQLMERIDDLVLAHGSEAAKATAAFIPHAGMYAVQRTAQATLGQVRDAARARRLAEVFSDMERRISTKNLLRLHPHYARRWELAWRSEYGSRWDVIARQIQQRIVQAARDGTSTNAVADSLSRAFGRLREPAGLTPAGHAFADQPIRGVVNEGAFARAATRTLLQEQYNRFGVEVAQEVGVTLFANFGVQDDRQSLICAAACEQPPMSLEDWQNWRRDPNPSIDGGPPLRHVLRCRDTLVGVLDHTKDEPGWTTQNPVADTYDYQYAGDFERKAA